MGAVGGITYKQMRDAQQAEQYYEDLSRTVKLTKNQRQTLEEYKIQSGELAAGLRDSRITEKDYRVKDIDAAIKKSRLSDNVVVYRALPLNALGVSNPTDAVGKTIVDKSYFSTTLNPRTMQKFLNAQTNGVGIIVRAKAGTPALSMSTIQSKMGTSEQEVLFGRNTKIKITGTKDIGGKTYLIADMK